MASRFKLGSSSKDKECVKVTFDILLKSAENVPVTGNVYVQWKRGSKNENKGESKHVAVKGKTAMFDEMLEISSTLYKIPKKGYESKNISITLKEEKGKKGASIAKTVIDLAEFAGKDEKRSFSLKSKKSKVAPTLTLHFKSKERAMAPDEDVTETDGVTEETNSDDEDSVEDFTEDNKSTTSSSSSSSRLSKVDSTPKEDKKDKRKDTVSAAAPTASAELDQLRAELDKAKKRTKELATENVDYEDKVKDLSKELEDLKKGKSTSPGGSDAAELRRQIKELTQEIDDKDEQIKKLKKDNEEAKQALASPQAAGKQDAETKRRMKELATENVDLEEQVSALKKELEEAKAQGGKRGGTDKSDESAKQLQDELRKKIKELTRANEDTEEEVETLRRQMELLKKSQSASSEKGDDSKRLQAELREKDERISDLENEIGSLQRKSSSNSSSDSTAIKELKEKVDNYKDKLRTQQEDSDRKLDSARSIEIELRDRIRDLEEESESASKAQQSSNSANRGQDREKYEREIEKEKESRKKAEKEALKLREKMEELEEQIKENGKHNKSNGREESKAVAQEQSQDKKIMEAVYSHAGQYSSSDGVSETALHVWKILQDTEAYLEDNDDHMRTVDDVIRVLKTACSCMSGEMSVTFYWLSTMCALLHMLRDEPNFHSNNDRDPIIDGVYQPVKEPPATSGLQDRLEWLAFTVYKQLIVIICDKLTPVLAPVIIEKPLTDKKTQVRTSPVMRIFDRVLLRTRNHYLYDAVVQQLFVQLFYFSSCHLVNTILQKSKLTPSIGFQIKLGLSHLEDWISHPSGSSAERALLAPCAAQLDSLRDVGGVLVLDKSLLADISTLQSIFRVLNLKQIKRLLEVFEADQLAQGGLPPHVREAVSTTWNNPQASSQPLLFDQNILLAFSPQFD